MMVVYINEKSLMEYHFESSNLKVFKNAPNENERVLLFPRGGSDAN